MRAPAVKQKPDRGLPGGRAWSGRGSPGRAREAPVPSAPPGLGGLELRRACACGGGCPRCRGGPVPALSAKLDIGLPGGPLGRLGLGAPDPLRGAGSARGLREVAVSERDRSDESALHARDVGASACSSGGGCANCRAEPGPMLRFERDQPATSQDKDAPVRTPPIEVQGFEVDEQFCDCDFQIEKEIAWVRQMGEIFEACQRESEGTAEDAIRCKHRKLDELGVKTVLVGSVDAKGKVAVADWPGLCGPIFRHGIVVHEGVHRDFLAHGEAPADAGAAKKKMRELSEVSAREYAANEVKAYRREERFLEKVLMELNQRCLPVRHRITNPDFYRETCGKLDLDLGLEMAPGQDWSRTQIHDTWSGLKGKCWWYLGPPGGGYNCYGHCLRGEGEPRVIEPGLQAGETFDDFFRDYGFEPSSGTGEIALFSESHVARRSTYTFEGRPLWESKLSREAPLILHELKDIEGAAFGNVIGFYSRVPDSASQEGAE